MHYLKTFVRRIKSDLRKKLIARSAVMPPKNSPNSKTVCVFLDKSYCELLDNWISFAKIPADWDFVVVCFDEESRAYAASRHLSTGFINSGRWVGLMWIARVLYLERLLGQYSRIVVSDIDAMWTGDPIAYTGLDAGADFVFSQGTTFPQDVFEATKTVVCCGWFVLKRSSATFETLRSVLKDMGQTFDDQVSFNRVFHRLGMRWDAAKMTSLPHDDVNLLVTLEPQSQMLANGCTVELLPMRVINRLSTINPEALVQHPVSPKDVKAKIDMLKSLHLWHCK